MWNCRRALAVSASSAAQRRSMNSLAHARHRYSIRIPVMFARRRLSGMTAVLRQCGQMRWRVSPGNGPDSSGDGPELGEVDGVAMSATLDSTARPSEMDLGLYGPWSTRHARRRRQSGAQAARLRTNKNAVPHVSHRCSVLIIPPTPKTWPACRICSLWQAGHWRSRVSGWARSSVREVAPRLLLAHVRLQLPQGEPQDVRVECVASALLIPIVPAGILLP
jgi:hypothetical protein